MGALLCPHHSPTTASLGTGPAERLAAAPARVQALSLHLCRDPKSRNLKGKRLELGDLEGSGQPRVGGIRTLILPKLFSGAETEKARVCPHQRSGLRARSLLRRWPQVTYTLAGS